MGVVTALGGLVVGTAAAFTAFVPAAEGIKGTTWAFVVSVLVTRGGNAVALVLVAPRNGTFRRGTGKAGSVAAGLAAGFVCAWPEAVTSRTRKRE